MSAISESSSSSSSSLISFIDTLLTPQNAPDCVDKYSAIKCDETWLVVIQHLCNILTRVQGCEFKLVANKSHFEGIITIGSDICTFIINIWQTKNISDTNTGTIIESACTDRRTNMLVFYNFIECVVKGLKQHMPNLKYPMIERLSGTLVETLETSETQETSETPETPSSKISQAIVLSDNFSSFSLNREATPDVHCGTLDCLLGMVSSSKDSLIREGLNSLVNLFDGEPRQYDNETDMMKYLDSVSSLLSNVLMCHQNMDSSIQILPLIISGLKSTDLHIRRYSCMLVCRLSAHKQLHQLLGYSQLLHTLLDIVDVNKIYNDYDQPQTIVEQVGMNIDIGRRGDRSLCIRTLNRLSTSNGICEWLIITFNNDMQMMAEQLMNQPDNLLFITFNNDIQMMAEKLVNQTKHQQNDDFRFANNFLINIINCQ